MPRRRLCNHPYLIASAPNPPLYNTRSATYIMHATRGYLTARPATRYAPASYRRNPQRTTADDAKEARSSSTQHRHRNHHHHQRRHLENYTPYASYNPQFRPPSLSLSLSWYLVLLYSSSFYLLNPASPGSRHHPPASVSICHYQPHVAHRPAPAPAPLAPPSPAVAAAPLPLLEVPRVRGAAATAPIHSFVVEDRARQRAKERHLAPTHTNRSCQTS